MGSGCLADKLDLTFRVLIQVVQTEHNPLGNLKTVNLNATENEMGCLAGDVQH